MLTDLAQNHKERPWIAWLAVAVLVLALLLRFGHRLEIPATVSYELEAAYRVRMGQSPYVDFYFDQLMPVIYWRMLTLVIAPVVAVLSGAPSDLSACVSNLPVLGTASLLATSALCLISFVLSWTVMKRFGQTVFAPPIRGLILLAMALATFAMSFEFGGQQHIFVLLLMPYFLTRWMVLEGARVPAPCRLVVAAMAAVGASFSIFHIFVVLAFELVESLARRSFRPLIETTFLAFMVFSLAFWLSLLTMTRTEWATLGGIILPLRLNAITHEDYAFYGFSATPDRKSLFYALMVAVIFSFGPLLRQPFLRPMATVSILGLIVWMTLVVGFSADALILTYFLTMLFTVQAFFAAHWLTVRYPRLFRRKKEIAFATLVVGGSLCACAYLVAREVHERILVKTGSTRIRLRDPSSKEPPSPELASVIRQNSKPGDFVLLVNSKLRPAFPLIRETGRTLQGYFLGTDLLGMLDNIRRRGFYEESWGTSEPMVKGLEKGLCQRLLADIIKYRPQLICVEGGDSEAMLIDNHVMAVVMKGYERVCEAQYYSDRLGMREITEANYNYWIYRLKPGADLGNN